MLQLQWVVNQIGFNSSLLFIIIIVTFYFCTEVSVLVMNVGLHLHHILQFHSFDGDFLVRKDDDYYRGDPCLIAMENVWQILYVFE